ncbi:hypothetical protein FJW03_16100 [Mesorhizobium sp. B4-1-4]|nr:hypothetical protein [Mesorhizobium sp. B4-1-4]UCI29388.1 hypothetical protein FJW03_16100 [Mesorhizobium sp. B4-1-4]
MGHAVVARAGVAPDQARVPVGQAGIRPLQQPVARAVELLPEARILDYQFHVGIVEEQIVITEWRGVGVIECCVARLLEIVEGKFVQLARQVAGSEERFDEILGPIGRASIADDPAVDMVDNRPETALEVRHLVFDDHVQAKPFGVCHW